MSWVRMSNSIVQPTFTKDALQNYISVQKEHKDLMEGRLNRQFGNVYVYTAVGTFLGLFGPIGVAGAAIVNTLNLYYATTLSQNIEDVEEETVKGYDKLKLLLGQWKSEYRSIKISIPVMRFRNSVTGEIVHLSAGANVYIMQANLTDGTIIAM